MFSYTYAHSAIQYLDTQCGDCNSRSKKEFSVMTLVCRPQWSPLAGVKVLCMAPH